MRCVEINKTPFAYANFKEKEPVLDSNGLRTGQYKAVYHHTHKAKGNISPAAGQVYSEMFGLQSSYSKVIVLDDPDFPMKEDAILWLGVPETGPHNYVVRKRAPSINFIAYAIEEVKVSG